MQEYNKKIKKYLVYAVVLLSMISVGCETTNLETQQKQSLSAAPSSLEQKAAVHERVKQLNAAACKTGDNKIA